MRGLSTMYLLACEEEQTLTNSGLVDFFQRLDVADSLEEACPRHIDLSENVLGDAGAAAFFRTLAVMRWVSTVNMRGTGAGPRAVAVLCDVVMCTDPSLMASAGTRPAALVEETKAEPAKAASTDVFNTEALVAPVPCLCAVDLVDNPIFQLSGKVLLRGLQRRERVVAAYYAAHPTAARTLPGLELTLTLQVFQPSLAKKLGTLKAAAMRQNARLQRRGVLAKQMAMLKLFCASPVDGELSLTAGLPRPVGAHAVYRIPELVGDPGEAGKTETADSVASSRFQHIDGSPVVAPPRVVPSAAEALAAGALSEPFYDWLNPLLHATVRRWNDNMDSYLSLHRSLVAAGAGPTAAAQLCVELGADALAGLSQFSSSAFVWSRHAAHRAARALAAAEDANAAKDDVDKLDPLELWLAVCEEAQTDNFFGVSAQQWQARRDAEARCIATEELLTSVGKLLRTLYACPGLETAVLARHSFILPSYIQRLRAWYYQSSGTLLDDATARADRYDGRSRPTSAATGVNVAGAEAQAPGTHPAVHERLEDMKLLYYRIVAALVTAPLTTLSPEVSPYFVETEARLADIRRLVVDCFGSGALPILSAQAQYVQDNDTAAARAWSAAYDIHPGQVPSPAPPAPTAVIKEAPMPLAALCMCGAEYLAATRQRQPTRVGDAAPSPPPPLRPVHLTVDAPLCRPCAVCCQLSIAALKNFLASPHTLARLEALRLAPLAESSDAIASSVVAGTSEHAHMVGKQLYGMPVEFRRFIADLVLRQATVRAGGCAFVPNMLGRTSSIHPPYFPIHHDTPTSSDRVLGLVELIAELHGSASRLMEVFSAFEEWYRLEALESFDITRTATNNRTK